MPFLQVLLLDEITVDLDVLGRADLLAFLRQEAEERQATIIYVRPSGACLAAMKVWLSRDAVIIGVLWRWQCGSSGICYTGLAALVE